MAALACAGCPPPKRGLRARARGAGRERFWSRGTCRAACGVAPRSEVGTGHHERSGVRTAHGISRWARAMP